MLWNFTGFLGKPHTVFLESDDSIEAFNPNEITIVKIEPGVKRFAYEKYILEIVITTTTKIIIIILFFIINPFL